ncbi:hypothetical protein [Streptomyces fractus]|uniref:hypothetical protein n=1 Tax=Streptomyces fractus TaxID=641806 RepID=UPI003CF033CF
MQHLLCRAQLHHPHSAAPLGEVLLESDAPPWVPLRPGAQIELRMTLRDTGAAPVYGYLDTVSMEDVCVVLEADGFEYLRSPGRFRLRAGAGESTSGAIRIRVADTDKPVLRPTVRLATRLSPELPLHRTNPVTQGALRIRPRLLPGLRLATGADGVAGAHLLQDVPGGEEVYEVGRPLFGEVRMLGPATAEYRAPSGHLGYDRFAYTVRTKDEAMQDRVVTVLVGQGDQSVALGVTSGPTHQAVSIEPSPWRPSTVTGELPWPGSHTTGRETNTKASSR